MSISSLGRYAGYSAVSANGYTLGPVLGQITAAAIVHGEAVNPHYRLERFG